MEEKILIGLVEDQALFREGIKAILSSRPGLEVIFESGDGYSVPGKLKECSPLPEVMLVDLSLPPQGSQEFSGLQLTRWLHEHYPDIKVLILSVHDDENFIAQLIEQGAYGYLVKDSSPKEVHEAILAVHQKGSYINERSLKAIQNNLGRKSKPKKAMDIQISKREVEVLQLVCQQMTAEEIAEKLFISVKTVNGHRNNLLQKTGSRNVTGLVIYALKNNIVQLI